MTGKESNVRMMFVCLFLLATVWSGVQAEWDKELRMNRNILSEFRLRTLQVVLALPPVASVFVRNVAFTSSVASGGERSGLAAFSCSVAMS